MGPASPEKTTFLTIKDDLQQKIDALAVRMDQVETFANGINSRLNIASSLLGAPSTIQDPQPTAFQMIDDVSTSAGDTRKQILSFFTNMLIGSVELNFHGDSHRPDLTPWLSGTIHLTGMDPRKGLPRVFVRQVNNLQNNISVEVQKTKVVIRTNLLPPNPYTVVEYMIVVDHP
jgi:hypothetical protein